MPKIIAISGKRGSGKDTVARILEKTEGYRPIALADTLRDLLLSINPIVMNNVVGGVPFLRLAEMVAHLGWEGFKESQPAEYRHLMTGLGAHGIHLIDENFLANIVINKIMNGDPSTKWVVTDLRFPSEYWKLRHFGAQIWRAHRPLTDQNVGDHISETALDNYSFDVRIYNDSDMYDLAEQVVVQHRRNANASVPF